MRNVTGGAVTGDDLFGRDREISNLWRSLEDGEHVLMMAPLGAGKSSLMRAMALAPPDRWDVVYADLEECDNPACCLAALVAGLARHPRFADWTRAISFPERVRRALADRQDDEAADRRKLTASLDQDWRRTAGRLQAAFRHTPSAARRLLIIFDELPYMLARTLQRPDGNAEADRLGQWIQEMQADPALTGRVQFLFAGSSGLENVLRYMGLTRINGRVAAFAVDAWSPETADSFLVRLGAAEGFELEAEMRAALLDRLGDPLPLHVQMLFGALRRECGGDARRLSGQTLDAAFERLLTDPDQQPLFDHYRHRLEVMFRKRELGLVHYCLARLCTSPDGLSVSRLEPRAYGLDRPLPVILRLLEEEGYVTRRRNSLMFRSNLLRQWWRRTQVTQ